MVTHARIGLFLSLSILVGLASPLLATDEAAPSLMLQQTDEGTSLSLDSGGTFYATSADVLNARAIAVDGTPVRVALWEEARKSGGVIPYYAISLDGGRTVATVRATSYLVQLQDNRFDPKATLPLVPASLKTGAANTYLVQFVTQPLPEYRAAIEALGGKVGKFLTNHTHIIQMDSATRESVEALPYVRWVGKYHAAYKLEDELKVQYLSGKEVEPRRYSIMLNERGTAAQERVCERITALGGKIHGTTPQGYRIEASMPLSQVRQIADLDDVMYIDRKGGREFDMDNVRELGGANYIETIAGYTGQGVRAEVADSECDLDHPEWGAPPIVHVPGGDSAHGTSVYGILFAQGVTPQARGLIPDGVGIFSWSDGLLGGGTTRYTHTAELVDPAGPYRAVLQTNSTGDPRTYHYTTISAEMDDILFINDVVHTQSQSNAGSPDSRPQAWAKNIISGGAVKHYDTLTRDDDCWCSSGSIGPADDGRIKPDLCFFYDETYTATAGGGYTEFGGTSGATPSIAGYTCLFLQMWADGIFGNEVDPTGDVFDNRCHMTTAKAVMINSANPYPFTGTSDDLTRVHQGWGNPDVRSLYDNRDNISVIDETEIIQNMETLEFVAVVNMGQPELRVTMVFADPMGVPAADEARINDLTLKVISPTGTEYWGNNGLLEGNWSVPGGEANTVDTVENVFLQNPTPGIWTIQVIASEINEDAHTETIELDADFALVVTGAIVANCTSEGRAQLNRAKYACEDSVGLRVVDCDLNLDEFAVETVSVTVHSDTESAGETVLLTETAENTADFRGTISISTTDDVGVLHVADGDTVTLTYNDADNGTGVSAIVMDTAVVDCQPPVVVAVATTEIEPRSARVLFDTDEATSGLVRYGLECGSLTETATQSGYGLEHSVFLSGLQDNTTYYYAVEAEDEAGNTVYDDNGGACYTFTTPEIPDFFTELFDSDNDLDFSSMTFTPNGSFDYYDGCVKGISELPTDPTGGTTVTLTDDDSEQITLTGGRQVSLYGTSYSSFYIGSNGFITFTSGNTDTGESLADHFDTPRISALFDDLDPPEGGTVSYKEILDRVVVTYQDIKEYSTSGTPDPNTFQIEMYYNGTIVLSYLDVAATDGLAGLSAGEGLSPDFYETDLSGMHGCGPQRPVAVSQTVATPMSTPVTFDIEATDDGLPSGELTYLITSLPNYTLKDAGNDYVITAADLPYTPVNDGTTLIYEPVPNQNYSDSFQFQADDGGDPEFGGGLSNTATVTIEVGGPQAVISVPMDTDPGWTTEGQWAFGRPTGQGGTSAGESGASDPTAGATGDNVYGYNLDGNYTHNMSSPHYLTTTAFDLRGVTGCELRFQRWLGVEHSTYDHATLEISTDGSTWVELWENPSGYGNSVNDGAWTSQAYDISDYADDEETVYIRWSMGPTDGSVSYCGWNIDDFEIWGLAPVVTCENPGDVNADGLVNGADIQAFIACELAGDATGACECADVASPIGEMTMEDAEAFVNLLIGA